MKKILIFILPLLISLSAHAHRGWLYNINSNEVQIIDLETKKLIRTVETGSIEG